MGLSPKYERIMELEFECEKAKARINKILKDYAAHADDWDKELNVAKSLITVLREEQTEMRNRHKEVSNRMNHYLDDMTRERDKLHWACKAGLDALHRCSIIGVVRQPRMDGVQWTNPNGERVVKAMEAMSKAIAGGEVK